MNVEQFKERIFKVLDESRSMQIYFVLRKNDGFDVKLCDVDHENGLPELAEMFEKHLKGIAAEDELYLGDLSSADERANAVYKYDYDDFPGELGVIKDFHIQEAVGRPHFSFDEDNLNKLIGYIIYIGGMEEGITLFKKHYPISLIKRDTFLLGKIKSEKRFEKIQGEDILRINDDFQLIKMDDEVYILELKILNHIAGFDLLIRKAAAEAIIQIEKMDILEDIQVLKDAEEDISFSRKLSKVLNNSPILTLGIKTEEILHFIKNTKEISGKFKYNEDATQIRLDTNASKKAFIQLLSDAYLRSELTKVCYEARAKDSIS